MTIQWLLIISFAAIVLLSETVFVWWRAVFAVVLSLSGVIFGTAAVISYWRVNGTIYIKPSPQPRSGDKLVTTGIYSKIRHPIYLAVMLFFLGIAIYSGHWMSLLFAVVVAMFYYIKLQFEESLLLEVHPRYAVYQKSTGALFPRLIKPENKLRDGPR